MVVMKGSAIGHIGSFLLTEFSADGLFPLIATVAIAAEDCGGTFAGAQGSRRCAEASQASGL
ncbi:hypothetical protein ACVW1A_003170 [Bradyrhizobium sp. LB1.3]